MVVDVRPAPHRIEFANALRGIAAIAVVLAHYCGIFWYSRAAVAQMTGMAVLPSSISIPAAVMAFNSMIAPVLSGPFGVGLFFLISGFVIPFSFDSLNRKQFLIGRFFRLWPTYFCGFLLNILIVIAALKLQNLEIPFSLRHIGFHAVLGGRELFSLPSIDGVIWTLETELRFYVLAVILGRAVLSRGSPMAYLVPALLLVFTLATQWLHAHHIADHDLAWARHEAFYFPYVIFMFIGVSLNFQYRGRQSIAVTALMIGALLPAAFLALGQHDFALYVAPSYGAALLVFLASRAMPRRIWTAAPLRFMAAISYPLYVVHALTGFALLNLMVTRFAINSYVALIATFAIVIALAWLLHVMIEAPTHEMGRRIARRLGSRPDSAAVRASGHSAKVETAECTAS